MTETREAEGFPTGKISLTIDFEMDGSINITAKDVENKCTYAFKKEPSMSLHNKVMDVLTDVGVSLVKG